MHTSLAVVPAQPAADSFSPDALNLFPVYTRASYKAAFGEDPPTYDVNLPTKGWFDSSGRISQFGHYVNKGGQVSFEEIDLSRIGAADINLYGIHDYPDYEIAPTTATRAGALIPAEYLCDVKVANELAWKLGVKDMVVVEEQDNSLFGVVYPPEEKRRICNIVFKENQQNAGLLLKWMNYEGVGAPGHWDTDSLQPTWVTEVAHNLPMPNPDVPVPQRQLLDNERVHVTPFGFTIYKVGVGSVLEAGATAPATGGGGFTDADREMLRQILTSVTGTADLMTAAVPPTVTVSAPVSPVSPSGPPQVSVSAKGNKHK